MNCFKNTGPENGTEDGPEENELFAINESSRDVCLPVLSCSGKRPFFRYSIIENNPVGYTVDQLSEPGPYGAFTYSSESFGGDLPSLQRYLSQDREKKPHSLVKRFPIAGVLEKFQKTKKLVRLHYISRVLRLQTFNRSR